MFETGQRSAISTSELGLYSDRGDRYNRSRYGPVIRKFVIVVMAVVAVVLTAIFIYDFTSGASASSKVSQETKHIYILQNALKKPSGFPKRLSTSTILPPETELNGTRPFRMQDRSDNANSKELNYVGHAEASEALNPQSWDTETMNSHPEMGSHSSDIAEVRKRVLSDLDANNDGETVEGKQLFNNHAVVYRVRQRYKYPDPSEEFNEEESRPAPFHFELKTPQPSSFNTRPKFPQLTQYRYPHSSRNIQDIIKYLTNDPDVTNRGIKFTGIYVNPKKYDLYPEVGEMMANSDRNEYQVDGTHGEDDDESEDEEFSESSRYAMSNNEDPFYPYKPTHPADVNLLAPSNVRFAPSGTHRYNTHYNPYFQRPTMNYARPLLPIPMQEVPQFSDNTAAYSSGSYGKKRKPKPFSVMLDIYPITELDEQPNNKKISRPRQPTNAEEYDPRRPLGYNRGQRYYPAPQAQPIPLVAVPAQSGLSEEEERQQMIFHLNLYPRKKNKLNRNDIIQRSESMRPEDHQKFMHSVMSPFDAITKQLTDHSTIEESKYEEIDLPDTTNSSPLTRYEQNSSSTATEDVQFEENVHEQNPDNNDSTGYENDEEMNNENSTSTEKNISDQTKECANCLEGNNPKKIISTDIDTPEGFQAFADGLVATD